jgi:hypothetical protein
MSNPLSAELAKIVGAIKARRDSLQAAYDEYNLIVEVLEMVGDHVAPGLEEEPEPAKPFTFFQMVQPPVVVGNSFGDSAEETPAESEPQKPDPKGTYSRVELVYQALNQLDAASITEINEELRRQGYTYTDKQVSESLHQLRARGEANRIKRGYYEVAA